MGGLVAATAARRDRNLRRRASPRPTGVRCCCTAPSSPRCCCSRTACWRAAQGRADMKPLRALPWALGATAFAVLPFVGNAYTLGVGLTLLMWLALTPSWCVLSKLTGYVSLGHVVFYGLGAYLVVASWGVIPLSGLDPARGRGGGAVRGAGRRAGAAREGSVLRDPDLRPGRTGALPDHRCRIGHGHGGAHPLRCARPDRHLHADGGACGGGVVAAGLCLEQPLRPRPALAARERGSRRDAGRARRALQAGGLRALGGHSGHGRAP